MSNSFSGFSEDDIKKLINTSVQAEDKPIKRVIVAKRRISNPSKSIISAASHSKLGPSMPEMAKLSSNNHVVAGQPPVDPKTDVITLNIPVVGKKMIDLDEFHAKQKRIEEQNRCRKELLSKALADRTKQTEEESRRLKEIQSEFKKLDALLSNDVAILRHQIELASLDFMEAQKRYHKIEKEFLDAKVTLHQKLEKKDMLTEHLCAIIEKNEERKADKLNDLMARLTSGDFPEGSLCNNSENHIVNCIETINITDSVSNHTDTNVVIDNSEIEVIDNNISNFSTVVNEN